MLTILWPCDRNKVYISSSFNDHLNRPGYNRAYAGTDLAGPEQPLRGSQHGGHVLQAHFSNLGYGYTTFVEYGGVLRIRNAHQKDLGVSVGDTVGPDTYIGTMDSTGNSTGTHTHFEVWVKYDSGWVNIDPLDTRNNIKLVNDAGDLEEIGEIEMPIEDYPIPHRPELPMVSTTAYITAHLNLRIAPFVGASIIGRVLPGEKWGFIDYRVDYAGNIWFALLNGDKVGWAAAYYGGKSFLEMV